MTNNQHANTALATLKNGVSLGDRQMIAQAFKYSLALVNWEQVDDETFRVWDAYVQRGSEILSEPVAFMPKTNTNEIRHMVINHCAG